MKANAPEKIYRTTTYLDNDKGKALWKKDPVAGAENIEYVRTDAFMKKADEFIGSFFHPDDTELRNCLLKKFHEYMKGE